MPAVAVNHQALPKAGAGGRDQAYRMVAELLVGFRRIVRRGLQRVCGDGWLEEGCPPEVRVRLEARREAELAMDRGPSDGGDPFSHVTFGDLASIIEANNRLAELLRPMAASAADLVENLRALEELRTKVAEARPLSERQLVDLEAMHLRLREKLSAARRRGRSASGEADRSLPANARPSATTTDRTTAAAMASGARRARPPVVEPVKPVEPDGPTTAAPPPASRPTAEAGDAGPIRPAVAARAAPPRPARAPYDPVGAAALDGAPTPVGLVRVAEDDRARLRELRREVIEAAELAYAQSDHVPMAVWSEAWQSGWYASRKDSYGLGEISTFYAVMEQYLDRLHRGADECSLRTFLADRELAKLLLRLRELFLRLKL